MNTRIRTGSPWATHSACWLARDLTGLLTPLPLKSQKPWVMFLTLPLADPVSLGLGFLGG